MVRHSDQRGNKLGALLDAKTLLPDLTPSTASTGTLSSGQLARVDATSGGKTRTLPLAVDVGAGAVVAVRKTDSTSNPVTIVRAGSDTINGSLTSRVLANPEVALTLVSDGLSNYSVVSTDTPATLLSATYEPLDQDRLTSGDGTLHRGLVGAESVTGTTGNLRLVYFTARRSETTTQVRIRTGATAAAATPTLVRLGLYTVASDGAGTLVASTANDTALLAVARTAYAKVWSVAYAKVAGQRYALGVLQVSGGATATFCGLAGVSGVDPITSLAPRLSGSIAAQSDLPGSFVDSGVSDFSSRIFAEILP